MSYNPALLVPVALSSGPSGAATPVTVSFQFNQVLPSALWTIVHQLGRYPVPTVLTTARDLVEGDVHYIDNNTLTLSFSAPFAGTAYLN